MHGTSIDFDGTGDYLTLPYHEDWEFDSDFTIEFWMHVPDNTPGSSGISQQIMGTGGEVGGSPADIAGWGIQIHTNGKFYFTAAASGNSPYAYIYDLGGYPNYSANAWTHVVVQRDCRAGLGGAKGIMFINGICIAPSFDNLTFPIPKGSAADGVLTIGREERDDDRDLSGYLDEIRISKGIIRYTVDGASQSGIVPSTSTGAGSLGTEIPTTPYLRPTPFVAADGGRGYFANTNVKLWIKSDSYPGDTTFVDYSSEIGQSPKLITNNGHTVAAKPLIKTTNSETDYALSGGSDAMYFDGSNDVIIVPAHPDLNFGSGDFTIECWFKGTSELDTSTGGLMAGMDHSWQIFNHTDALYIYLSSNGTSWDIHGTFSSNLIAPAADIAPNVWAHLVFQRNEGAFSAFLNGISTLYEDTTVLPIKDNNEGFRIGASRDPTYWQGYLDEIRWSKMARYTNPVSYTHLTLPTNREV